MTRTFLIAALLATAALTACDRPAVVAVPVAVPGPAGATGATGATGGTGMAGSTGNTGAAGKAGDGTTVIVVAPPASAPAN